MAKELDSKTSYRLKIDGDKLILYTVTSVNGQHSAEEVVKEIAGGFKLMSDFLFEYWVEEGKIIQQDGKLRSELAQNTEILSSKRDILFENEDPFHIKKHIRAQDLKNVIRYSISLDHQQNIRLLCRIYDNKGHTIDTETFHLSGSDQKVTFKDVNGEEISYSYKGSGYITKQIGDKTETYTPQAISDDEHDLLIPGNEIDLSNVVLSSYNQEGTYKLGYCILKPKDRNLSLGYLDKNGQVVRSTFLGIPQHQALDINGDGKNLLFFLQDGREVIGIIRRTVDENGKVSYHETKQGEKVNLGINVNAKGKFSNPMKLVDYDAATFLKEYKESKQQPEPTPEKLKGDEFIYTLAEDGIITYQIRQHGESINIMRIPEQVSGINIRDKDKTVECEFPQGHFEYVTKGKDGKVIGDKTKLKENEGLIITFIESGKPQVQGVSNIKYVLKLENNELVLERTASGQDGQISRTFQIKTFSTKENDLFVQYSVENGQIKKTSYKNQQSPKQVELMGNAPILVQEIDCSVRVKRETVFATAKIEAGKELEYPFVLIDPKPFMPAQQNISEPSSISDNNKPKNNDIQSQTPPQEQDKVATFVNKFFKDEKQTFPGYWSKKAARDETREKFVTSLTAALRQDDQIKSAIEGLNDDKQQEHANKILYALANIEFKEGKGAIFMKNDRSSTWQTIVDFITCAFRAAINFDSSIMDNFFKKNPQVIIKDVAKLEGFINHTVTEKEAGTGKSMLAKAIEEIGTQTQR